VSAAYVQPAPPLNVANAVTVMRIALVAPLVWLLMATPRGSTIAAVAFLVLAASDALDGYLARKRGLVTTLGKLLDPIADKLLVGGALVALVDTGRLPFAAAAIILGREALVSALRWVAYRRGRVVAANVLGKVKMGLQVVMVVALAAFGGSASPVLDVLVVATVAVTVISGLSYLKALAPDRATTTSRGRGARAPAAR
jgi:CDP-diacylglycerol---glycerol-3-phosphate 3-phosphatidyltransferase